MKKINPDIFLMILGSVVIIILGLFVLFKTASFSINTSLVSVISIFFTAIAAMAATRSAYNAEISTKISQELLNRQREVDLINNKPILMILEKEVDFEIMDSELEKDTDIYKYNWDKADFSLDGTDFSEKVTIPIINLGKGFAKDICIEWKIINIENLISFINKEQGNIFYKEICLKKEYDAFIHLEVKCIKHDENPFFKSSSEYPLCCYEKQEIIYLSGEEGKSKIYIPDVFVSLLNIYSFTSLRRSQAIEDLFPQLEYKVVYKDINDVEYTDDFTINITKLTKKGHFSSSNPNLKLKLEPKKIKI